MTKGDEIKFLSTWQMGVAAPNCMKIDLKAQRKGFDIGLRSSDDSWFVQDDGQYSE